MITPQEARQRTRTLVEHYVNECECRDLTDVKHVLTALISMATGHCGDQRKGGCPAGTDEHTHPHGRA